MKFSKSLLLGLSFVALFGCSAGVEEKKEALATAQTERLALTGLRIESVQKLRESDTSLHTITSKTYTLFACFKESALGKRVQYKKFTISGIDFPAEVKESTVEGCITWDENVTMD
ncbi:putative lipoprotein, partial [Bacteriovorax sp. BSW11_IV]|uniref:hypothetical protein n=1 Tax=Bacteriovorax sp. BSW11_IV TaxID=1353529 RepID=UPI00038A5259